MPELSTSVPSGRFRRTVDILRHRLRRLARPVLPHPRSPRGRVPAMLSMVLLVGPLFWVNLGFADPDDLPEVAEAIEESHPSVAHVGVEELERELTAPPEERPLLVDARAPEEYAVSHLPGALRAETEEEALSVLAEVPRDRPVVVYCSVGLRSAKLAEKLEAAGFADVRNLRGSIFAWANRGRAVVRGGEVVREVHPYDGKWGKLLREELRADVE